MQPWTPDQQGTAEEALRSIRGTRVVIGRSEKIFTRLSVRRASVRL
jgi:hypothetical protein